MEYLLRAMKHLVASFQEPLTEETILKYIEYLRTFDEHEIAFIIKHAPLEFKKFPSIQELVKMGQDHRRANKAWGSAVETARMLEDKELPQWKRRDGSKDHTPEARAARMRQLNKYPSVLKRYSDEENRI